MGAGAGAPDSTGVAVIAGGMVEVLTVDEADGVKVSGIASASAEYGSQPVQMLVLLPVLAIDVQLLQLRRVCQLTGGAVSEYAYTRGRPLRSLRLYNCQGGEELSGATAKFIQAVEERSEGYHQERGP